MTASTHVFKAVRILEDSASCEASVWPVSTRLYPCKKRNVTKHLLITTGLMPSLLTDNVYCILAKEMDCAHRAHSLCYIHHHTHTQLFTMGNSVHTSWTAVHSMPSPSIPLGQSPHENSVSVTLVHNTASLKQGCSPLSTHGSNMVQW